MRRAFGGAVLVIAGIAAVIIAYSNHHAAYANIEGPSPLGGALNEEQEHLHAVAHPATGLSQLAFDLIRIGGAALVIFGALLIVMGLISYSAAQRE
jgi:hypothetical protein